MRSRPSVAYRCDGSLAGILCCIYESYTKKELPTAVIPTDQAYLFSVREIETEEQHALRVWRSIAKSPIAALLVRDCWLADRSGREQLLFAFIQRFYELGQSICDRLDDPVCAAVYKSAQAVRMEAHRLRGFVRFSERAGVLVAQIEPKGMVLPLVQEHFINRYSCERFVIFDRTHRQALFYQNGNATLQEVDEIALAPASEKEQQFEALWVQYYHSIAIEERYNPRCRMNHMPKRFWAQMLEVQGGLALPQKNTAQLPSATPSQLIKISSCPPAEAQKIVVAPPTQAID